MAVADGAEEAKLGQTECGIKDNNGHTQFSRAE